jgi:hypothetical protein
VVEVKEEGIGADLAVASAVGTEVDEEIEGVVTAEAGVEVRSVKRRRNGCQ